MVTPEKIEDFEYWLADMDDALDRFFASISHESIEKLDFSPSSLNIIEAWILARYASTQEMLRASESRTVDGLARYIGETFRRAIGGHWNMRIDDPNYAYYGKPQLTGFNDKPTPVCPLSLATASADRRTGIFLASVLASYLRDKEAKKNGMA